MSLVATVLFLTSTLVALFLLSAIFLSAFTSTLPTVPSLHLILTLSLLTDTPTAYSSTNKLLIIFPLSSKIGLALTTLYVGTFTSVSYSQK